MNKMQPAINYLEQLCEKMSAELNDMDRQMIECRWPPEGSTDFLSRYYHLQKTRQHHQISIAALRDAPQEDV